MKVITTVHYGGGSAKLAAVAHLIGTQHRLKTQLFSGLKTDVK